MNEKMLRAKELLRGGGYTLVCCNAHETITEHRRGVAPLMHLLNEKKSLCGFCAADKVVGRAAAFLYVLLEVDALHAEVISEHAKEVLLRYQIPFSAAEIVPAIRNRAGDGFCPMETATRDVTDPHEALDKIKEVQKRLQQDTK